MENPTIRYIVVTMLYVILVTRAFPDTVNHAMFSIDLVPDID